MRQSLEASAHLAVLLAHRWPLLLRAPEMAKLGNQRYWTASRARLERWAAWINYFEHARQPADRPLHWRQLRGLFQEILTAELTTRVWAAVASTMDRDCGQRELEPYAANILIAHLDARHRCLKLLIDKPALTDEQAADIHQLCERSERWSDLLLSYLSSSINVEAWACDEDRVADFSTSTAQIQHSLSSAPLIFEALKSSLIEQEKEVTCLHPELNHQVVDSLLTAFGPDFFDATGSFGSLWKKRILQRTGDLMTMLTDLASECDLPASMGTTPA